ncbi:uncharacterized protein PITG_00753 [Phytophthora infestans T30-4]|uniref:Uncharacterized protein n=1 Tax=Phytophthora infestans (strain T30-4) TaxID=403677 RepID=D0MRL7_PHYIT|nr:uncharacterized protein PITG_00753 [Phytophthora infestans T30-4]EEY58136.1 hypothetical protein PITG_00753 [Phytophthora infestans T30-4]|eukprot:XP_002909322.1 hypothetical protein PITG_00753 [Phytophthora infestans T30-4]
MGTSVFVSTLSKAAKTNHALGWPWKWNLRSTRCSSCPPVKKPSGYPLGYCGDMMLAVIRSSW